MREMTSKELLEIFAQNVKCICKQKNICIGDLEKQIGISKGYLTRASKYKNAISLWTTYPISKSLETSIDDLLNKDMTIEYRIQELKEELAKLESLRGADQ